MGKLYPQEDLIKFLLWLVLKGLMNLSVPAFFLQNGIEPFPFYWANTEKGWMEGKGI